MASISSKNTADGNPGKRFLSLDQKIKILDEVKKRKKINCREIAE